MVQRNRCDGCPTSVASTLYAVTGRPPLDAGAAHETDIEVEYGTMTPMVGDPGTVGIVNDVVAAIDCPTLLMALTDTVSGAPFCKPVIVHAVDNADASVHVPVLEATT